MTKDDPIHSLWMAAAAHQFAEHPELVADLLHTQNNLWAGELARQPDDTYAKPLLDVWLKNRAVDATVTTAGAFSPKLVSGPLAVFSLLEKFSSASRAEQGLEAWRRYPDVVMTAIGNLPLIERAQRQYVEKSPSVTPMTLAAENSLRRIDELWASGVPRPDNPESLLRAFAGGGQGDVPVLASQKSVIKAFEDLVGQGLTGSELSDALRRELAAVRISQSNLEEQFQAIADQLQDTASRQANAQDWAKRQAEIAGAGRIAGMLIGLGDPQAGAAVTTVLEQGMVLLGAVDVGLTEGLSFACVASGLGAALAIGGALGMLGGSSDQSLAQLDKVLSRYMDRLSALVKQGNMQLRAEIRRLGVTTDEKFLMVAEQLTSVSAQVARMESCAYLQSLEDDISLLLKALIRMSTSPSEEHSIDAANDAYTATLRSASSEKYTQEHTGNPTELTRELSAIYFDIDQAAPYRWRFAGNSTFALSRLLELYPCLMLNARAKVQDALRSEWGTALDADARAGLQDALAWPPRGLTTTSNELLVGGGGASPKSYALSLPVASYAFGKLLTVFQAVLLDPSLRAKDLRRTPSLLEMVEDCRNVMTVQKVQVGALGSIEVRELAQEAWISSAERVVNELIQRRMNSGAVKGGQESWNARLALFAGATRLFDETGATVYDLYFPTNPFEVSAEVTAIPQATSIDTVIADITRGLANPVTVDVRPVGELGLVTVGSEIRSDALLNIVGLGLALGCSLSLSTIEAHAEGCLDWHGGGDFFETCSVGLLTSDGNEIQIGYLTVRDRRRGLPPDCITYAEIPGRTGFDGTEIGGWTTVTIQGRSSLGSWNLGRLNRDQKFDDNRYCPGAVDQRGIHLIQEYLEEASSKDWSSCKSVRLKTKLLSESMDLQLKVQPGWDPQTLIQSHFYEVMARFTGGQLDRSVVNRAHGAWQFALTVSIAAADSGGPLAAALRHLARCPIWLRNRIDFTATLGTKDSQSSFGGLSLSNLCGTVQSKSVARTTDDEVWAQIAPAGGEPMNHQPGVGLLIEGHSNSIRFIRRERTPGERDAVNNALEKESLSLLVTSVTPNLDRALASFEDAMLLIAQVRALHTPDLPPTQDLNAPAPTRE